MGGRLLAGVEAGGTKMLCALADEGEGVLAEARIPTRDPATTFDAIAQFYARAIAEHGAPVAAGVASFGPLDLDRRSSTYGTLTGTPKSGWSGVDIGASIAEIVRAPAAVDTDVNCAALAELRRGAARGLDRICYVTIGTGIGVGIVEHGRTNTGAGHPEAGHMQVRLAPGDAFPGVCPAHGNCLEGLASGPAIRARWGQAAEDIPDEHAAWAMQAHYVAALCVNLTYTVRPQRIVIGGGVMERPALLPAVRTAYAAITAGYAPDRFSGDVGTYIVAPELTNPSAGMVGALAMAADLADRRAGTPA